MKKSKHLLVLLAFPLIFLGGCNSKTFAYQTLERDNYNTGGNLTFVYDEISHTAIFGGEGEIVQFYGEDVAKGWTGEGCRVGVQLFLPIQLKDYKSATAVLNNKKMNAEDFIMQSDTENPQYAIFQPIVSPQQTQIDLKITWQEGYEEQIYHIVIKQGTLFMEKNE